jgi:hypothetical protein
MSSYNYTREQVRVIELYYTCGTKVGSTAILGHYTSKQCMRHMLQLVWVSVKLCVSMSQSRNGARQGYEGQCLCGKKCQTSHKRET